MFGDDNESAEGADFYRTVFATSDQPLVIFDAQGRNKNINEAVCTLMGYTRSELLDPAFSWLKAAARPEDARIVEDSIAGLIATGTPCRYESSYRTGDGRTITCLNSDSALGGGLFVCSMSDITQLRQLESVQAEKTRYWRQIFNTTTQGVCIFDMDGGLYDMNPAYCDLTGYSYDELMVMGWLELTTEEYRDEDPKHLPDIMAGKLVQFDKAYRHKDGHSVPINVSFRLLERQPDWNKDRLICCCVNLSSMVSMQLKEQQLAEEKAFWREIFNGAGVGMVIAHDRNGLPRIDKANSTFCRMLGYSEKESQQPGFFLRITPENKVDKALLAEAKVKGGIITYEKPCIHKDGRIINTVISTTPTISQPGWIIATFSDVTVLKAREEEIRHLQRLSRAFLEQLAAGRIVLSERDESSHEAGEIQRLYNNAAEKLQGLIGAVQETAGKIMISSEGLHESQRALSHQSGQDAAQLEQISAAIEELSSAVSENAHSARSTQALAQQGADALEPARSTVLEVTQIIQEAVRVAHQTRDIAQRIQQIAFSTNILALNAAIEAARAGDHGRGFAVIAQEIRELSLSVTEGAKESEGIVNALTERMGRGDEGIHSIARLVEDMSSIISETAKNVSAIASATQEQDLGLQDTAKAVQQLEHGLGRTVERAEGIQSTSQTMAQESRALLEQLEQFVFK